MSTSTTINSNIDQQDPNIHILDILMIPKMMQTVDGLYMTTP